MNWVFIFAYLGLQLLIGVWISKRITSEDDYLLGGRNLSLFMVSFSLFATWFGAETCMGSSAAVYEKGLSGSRADPLGYGICLLLMGLILAAKLRRSKYVTLADFFRERYGQFIEKFAIWVIIPSSLIWAAAQLRAIGQVLSATTPLPVKTAIMISAFFVILYTSLGGLLGDIYTDLIQGVIIISGLLALFFICLHSIPDLHQILVNMDSERFNLIAPHESFLERMDRWMVPILGSLVAQEAISRILAAKSVSIARNASFVACGIYLTIGSIPVFLGLIGPVVLPGLLDSEHLLIRLAELFLPKVLFVLFSGALLSAILATVDSILLAIAALLSHNLIIPVFRIQSQRAKIMIARMIVLTSGVIASVIAINAKGIYSLVITASAFGTAGILVITLLGLLTKIGGKLSAFLALTVGLMLTPLCTYVLKVEAPFLTSILGATLVFLIGDTLSKHFSLFNG